MVLQFQFLAFNCLYQWKVTMNELKAFELQKHYYHFINSLKTALQQAL